VTSEILQVSKISQLVRHDLIVIAFWLVLLALLPFALTLSSS
jgi:hypothetical protein